MLKIFKNLKDLNKHTADLFIRIANESISEKGSFTVALTGGSSPNDLYNLLASDFYRKKMDWSKVFVFWGDERWVPLTSEQSNAGAAFKNLLNNLPIPKNQIFPMFEEGVNPEVFAKTYESLLDVHLLDSKHFDLILLGMGEDGHTASLFPGESVLEIQDQKVFAYYLKEQNMYRITLTAPIINEANNILFLVFGEKKKAALFEVLEGTQPYQKYPSKLIKPKSGHLYWMVDRTAASKL